MIDYIKIYQDITGIAWDSSRFDIHHINMNRKDNRIINLTLLPKILHKKYHYWSKFTFNYKDFLDIKNLDYCVYANASLNIEKSFENFLDIKRDVVLLNYLKDVYVNTKLYIENENIIEEYKHYPHQLKMMEMDKKNSKRCYLEKLKELSIKYS